MVNIENQDWIDKNRLWILVSGSIIGIVVFTLALWTIYDYEQAMIDKIPEMSCYKLEIEYDLHKPTSKLSKELQKEFEIRNCESIRGNIIQDFN